MVALTNESASSITSNRVSRRRKASKTASVKPETSIKQASHVQADDEELFEDELEAGFADDESRERRRLDRRRQIDPTTCERDYSDLEVEFMRAMDDYKRKSGRPFPTWSEVLEVVYSLGYRKVEAESAMEWKTYGDGQRHD